MNRAKIHKRKRKRMTTRGQMEPRESLSTKPRLKRVGNSSKKSLVATTKAMKKMLKTTNALKRSKTIKTQMRKRARRKVMVRSTLML